MVNDDDDDNDDNDDNNDNNNFPFQDTATKILEKQQSHPRKTADEERPCAIGSNYSTITFPEKCNCQVGQLTCYYQLTFFS